MEQKEKKVSYNIKSMLLKKFKDVTGVSVSYQKITVTPKNEVFTKNRVEEHPKQIHEDLTDALKAFVPHFLIACELKKVKDFSKNYFSEKKYMEDSVNETYVVTGFHLKEHTDHQSIILVGRRVLSNGRVISMVPPAISLNDEGDDSYALLSDLKEALNNVVSETELNLEGKIKVDNQFKMSLSSTDQEHNEKIEKEAKKKSLKAV